MSRYYYDLHTHSCLSPCADDDNTPNNLLGMAHLSGINILALTDHNTAKNCPAFFKAAENYEVIPIAGMELTTSEDIHIICLFEDLQSALDFDKHLDAYRILIINRPEIFGHQLVTDENDTVIEEEKNLLSNATLISIEDVPDHVEKFGGVCYPAHIDRDANGIISTLGTFPETPFFSCVELHDGKKIAEYKEKYGLNQKKFIVSSDAHYLTDINDKENFFELDGNGSPELVRRQLFKLLKNGEGTL